MNICAGTLCVQYILFVFSMVANLAGVHFCVSCEQCQMSEAFNLQICIRTYKAYYYVCVYVLLVSTLCMSSASIVVQ